MDTDINKSLAYAKQAASLGDSASNKIQADILDSGLIKNTQQLSANRIQLISQLISKLDPFFSYNVLKSDSIKNSGFINFATGEVKLKNLNYNLLQKTFSSMASIFVGGVEEYSGRL